MADSEDDSSASPDPSKSGKSSEERSRLANVPAIASPDPDSNGSDEYSDETDDAEITDDDTFADRTSELPSTAPLTSSALRPGGTTPPDNPGPSRTVEIGANVSSSKELSEHVFEVPRGRPPSAARSTTSPKKRASEPDTSPRTREGVDVHSALVQSNAYHWGTILSNSYQHMYDELLVISLSSTLKDAEDFKRRARLESKIFMKMKYYMQAVSSYCNVADHYEDTVGSPAEAFGLYEYALEQLDSGLELLRKGRRNLVVERFLILSLRMKAWLCCTLFMSKGMAMKREPLKGSHDEFLATALSLGASEPENLPENIALSSQVLVDVAELQDQNDLLVCAVGCWAEAEALAEKKEHEQFIGACESSVDTSIAMTSSMRSFMDFARETLCRIALYI